MDIVTAKNKKIPSDISNYIDEFLPFQLDHQIKLQSVLQELPRSADVFRAYWVKETERGNDDVMIWIYDTDSNLNVWRPATVRTCLLNRGLENDGYPSTMIAVPKYEGHYYYELDDLINTKWKIMERRE